LYVSTLRVVWLMGGCPDSGRTQHLLMAANTRKSVRLLAEVLGIRVLTNGTGVPSKLILFVDDSSSCEWRTKGHCPSEIRG
jgi:hypothetical protein